MSRDTNYSRARFLVKKLLEEVDVDLSGARLRPTKTPRSQLLAKKVKAFLHNQHEELVKIAEAAFNDAEADWRKLHGIEEEP